MIKEKAISILDSLISKGSQLAIEMKRNPYDLDNALSIRSTGFDTECLEAIKKIIGDDSEYYTNFLNTTRQRSNEISISRGVELLKSLKNTVDDGLIDNIKTIAMREVYGEIADEANDMLQKGYQANAAIHIGISLETRLRALCKKNSIPTEIGTPPKHIATATLNDELVKKGVYDTTTHKHITAWLGIRNSAAHGRGNEFNKGQVEGMITGIKNFLDSHPT